jgi:hypothetical protein
MVEEVLQLPPPWPLLAAAAEWRSAALGSEATAEAESLQWTLPPLYTESRQEWNSPNLKLTKDPSLSPDRVNFNSRDFQYFYFIWLSTVRGFYRR